MSITISGTYELQHCISCGCPMVLTASFVDDRRRDHRGFYCPNGHCQSYSQETPEEKAKRLLRDAEVRLQHEREQRAAAQLELDRMKKRVAKGICTKCNRQFLNLKRHMACKHKDG